MSFDRFYVDFDEYDDFIDALATKDPVCFSEESEMLKTKARWYRIDKLLSGNRNTLWMNPKHIISSENIKYGWCVKTDEIKYFFTRGVIFNNLYVGSEKNIRLSNVKNDDVRAARKFIKNHGGNIADGAEVTYNDRFTPSVIFFHWLYRQGHCVSSEDLQDRG